MISAPTAFGATTFFLLYHVRGGFVNDSRGGFWSRTSPPTVQRRFFLNQGFFFVGAHPCVRPYTFILNLTVRGIPFSKNFV